jgi:hypothetical protein
VALRTEPDLLPVLGLLAGLVLLAVLVLALLAGLLALLVGWPAAEGTMVVAFVELGGMAEGEGLVEILLGAMM